MNTRRAKAWIALFAGFLVLGVYAGTNYPAWWVDRGVVDTNRLPNDYGPVNQGQLKWTARCAADELDENLSGGAGPAIDNLISSFTLTNNFYPANLGQLKYVARPFCDRLIEEGYATSYPWTPTTTDDADYAPAVLGQLKNAFSFDLAEDSDGDGMPDWWEVRWFGGVTNWTGTNDVDDDALSNAEEYSWGTNPLNTDSDDDGFSDSEEVNELRTNPRNSSDGAEMIKEMRMKISANWSLIYSTPLVFTNPPGSAADLNDIRTVLLTLSGRFYEAGEE